MLHVPGYNFERDSTSVPNYSLFLRIGEMGPRLSLPIKEENRAGTGEMCGWYLYATDNAG